MNKHTPGPWKHDEVFGLIKYGKTEVCALHSGNAANAKLIASAPELLDALENLLKRASSLDQSAGHDGLQNCQCIASARNAIAKAKGEA